MDLPRLVLGINHVALEVGDHRGGARVVRPATSTATCAGGGRDGGHRHGRPVRRAVRGPQQAPDDGRHFGLVVDDKEAVRATLQAAGADIGAGRRLASATRRATARDRRLPRYPVHQDAGVPGGMGIEALEKRPAAIDQLREKGLLKSRRPAAPGGRRRAPAACRALRRGRPATRRATGASVRPGARARPSSARRRGRDGDPWAGP